MKLTDKQKQAQLVLANKSERILYYMLFGGSRCVSGDTVIDGQSLTIKQLAEIGEPVNVITTRGTQKASAPFLKGKCGLLKIVLENGSEIEVTPDHKFYDGKKWIKADKLFTGFSLAVQSCGKSPPQSISESFLLKFRANVLHLIEKFLSCLDGCFLNSRQYGLQPHSAQVCVEAYRASQFDGQGHSRFYRCVSWLLSSTRTQILQGHALKYNQNDQLSFHFSRQGDFPCSYHDVRSLIRVFARTFLQFLDLRSLYRLSQRLFSHHGLIAEAIDGALYRFCQFFCLSYDTPKNSGYLLSKIISITETAEKEYYTIHVPVSEQYFANGILSHNSGKTFLLTRNICVRAIKAPGSRHSINRFRFNACKQSIALETFPNVMSLCFPEVAYKIDKTDWYAKFENGSEVWFNGLDDKERVEKALGKEYATIYNNECSQIPLSSRDVMRTRLAQKVYDTDGDLLNLREYNDCNPPTKAHWSYREFIKKQNPETKQPLVNPDDYFSFQMNPQDNLENIAPNYLEMLQSQSARIQRRFLLGEFADDNPNALFNETDIDKWRVIDGVLPDFIRVVVAVDPSGAGDTDNADNDAIGIVVAALGADGNGYLLEDCTVKASPKVWGGIVASAFDRYNADVVVAEMNFGGEMVRHVIQTARPRTPFKPVTASRGKVVRAEPISALYETGKVRHVGFFNELEDELCAFSSQGYVGETSPNRADAAVWAFTALFQGIVNQKDTNKNKITITHQHSGWMSK